MKINISLVFCSLVLMNLPVARSQTTSPVTLDSCHSWAHDHYPLTGQYGLLEQTRDLTLENIATHNLPSLQLTGQATWQSEVTEIPLEVPGLDIPSPPLTQYNAYAEVNQSLTGFKTTRAEKALAHTNHLIQHQSLEVNLYQLYERVNTFFFGILLLEAQIEQIRISNEDLNLKINQLSQAKPFGTILQSDIDQLRASSLKLDQQIFAAESKKKRMIRNLSQLTGHSFTSGTHFQRPEIPTEVPQISRPEEALFELEKQEIDQQMSLFQQQLKPQLSLFARGGVGRPALNFLDDGISPYFIGGFRFQWNLASRYTRQRKMEIWEVQKRMIDANAYAFNLNTELKLSRYEEEIEEYNRLLTMDQELIDLRKTITETAGEQLTRGILTPVDYTTILHEEEKARQSRALNEILLLQAHYNRLYENGN